VRRKLAGGRDSFLGTVARGKLTPKSNEIKKDWNEFHCISAGAYVRKSARIEDRFVLNPEWYPMKRPGPRSASALRARAKKNARVA